MADFTPILDTGTLQPYSNATSAVHAVKTHLISLCQDEYEIIRLRTHIFDPLNDRAVSANFFRATFEARLWAILADLAILIKVDAAQCCDIDAVTGVISFKPNFLDKLNDFATAFESGGPPPVNTGFVFQLTSDNTSAELPVDWELQVCAALGSDADDFLDAPVTITIAPNELTYASSLNLNIPDVTGCNPSSSGTVTATDVYPLQAFFEPDTSGGIPGVIVLNVGVSNMGANQLINSNLNNGAFLPDGIPDVVYPRIVMYNSALNQMYYL